MSQSDRSTSPKMPKMTVGSWHFVCCDGPNCDTAAVSENFGTKREAQEFLKAHRQEHRDGIWD